jgi:L-asparaginase II
MGWKLLQPFARMEIGDDLAVQRLNKTRAFIAATPAYPLVLAGSGCIHLSGVLNIAMVSSFVEIGLPG